MADIAPSPPRIVIAEDDDDIRTVLVDSFLHDGFDVSHSSNGVELVNHLEQCRNEQNLPDLILLDHRMPGWCGLDVLEALKENDWPTPIILITAYGKEVTDSAVELGVSAVLDKPFDLDVLRTFVDCLIDLKGFERKRLGDFAADELGPLEPRCVACDSTQHIRLDPKVGGVRFCADCLERARPPYAAEDIGVAD